MAESVKWFWVWVWRLRKERARLVLAGLRFADGNEAANLERSSSPPASTSATTIVRLALHAGYAARFSLMYKEGDHRGYDAAGEAIIAQVTTAGQCGTLTILKLLNPPSATIATSE